MHNAAVQGARLHEGLLELKRRHSMVGDVRGLGLMRAMDLLDPGQGNAANPALRDRMVQMAFERGLLLLGCGKNAIRFCPPLCVTAAQIDTALQILDDLLASREAHPAIAS
jgi:4-aminobutyrate aminotransferase